MSKLDLLQQLIAAVYMVGNIDTPEDMDAWWLDFNPLWEEVAKDPLAQKYADQMALESMANRQVTLTPRT